MLFMKRYGKSGQFFLLAAVIISAVIISLGVTTNQAITNSDPDGFEDFTYEVKKETGSVMDYEIYTNFEDGDDLDEFVQLLSQDIKDRDRDANFMFIYGNQSGLTVRNYGADSAFIDDEEVEGGGGNVINRICLGVTCQDVEEFAEEFGEGSYHFDPGAEDSINGTVFGVDYEFPITEHRQVIFLIQKTVADENYVSIR